MEIRFQDQDALERQDCLYWMRVAMKKMELRSSARPTTPVTASVWMGWTANKTELINAKDPCGFWISDSKMSKIIL